MIVPPGFTRCPRCGRLIVRDGLNPRTECTKECRAIHDAKNVGVIPRG